MTGEGFWQVEFVGIWQDGDSHLNALHTLVGYTLTACEEHWRHKQGLGDDLNISNFKGSFEPCWDKHINPNSNTLQKSQTSKVFIHTKEFLLFFCCQIVKHLPEGQDGGMLSVVAPFIDCVLFGKFKKTEVKTQSQIPMGGGVLGLCNSNIINRVIIRVVFTLCDLYNKHLKTRRIHFLTTGNHSANNWP